MFPSSRLITYSATWQLHHKIGSELLLSREPTIGTMEVNLSTDGIKKQKTGEESYVGGDRIGLEDLPEPILLHILSFLPTKDVMKASVLSKRWKYLWKSVNNFRFEEKLFCTRSQRNLFRDAVDRVLLLRDPINIHCFSLSCGVDNLCEDEINYGYGFGGDGDSNEDGDGDGDNDSDGSDGNGDDENSDDDNDGSDGDGDNDDAAHINSWISAALTHKVQVLKLRLSACLPVPLHSSLFTCESLTELKLNMFEGLILPSHICLSRLKILTLKHLGFLDEQSTNQLFSSCPVLEKLTLDKCIWDSLKTVYIDIPTLQNLLIFEDGDDEGGCRVVISGKSIKTFDYGGELMNDYCLCDLSSLVDCSIVMRDVNGAEKEGRQNEVAYRAHKLLGGLFNVRDLYLCDETIQALNYTKELFSQLPVFSNLTFLRVNFGPVDFACGALQTLLQKCPSLTTLEFPRGITLNSAANGGIWKLDPVPSCFLTQLKTVLIGDFKDTEAQRNAAFTFVEFAGVLERLCITLGGFEKENEESIHLISIPMRWNNGEICVHT